MPYRINMFQAGKLISTEIWDGPTLPGAQVYATNAVEAGDADNAEIRNTAGKGVFYYPRISRHA